MPSKGKGLGQRPLWIIASNQASRLDVLTVDPDEDDSFLPLFSFEEEAETFLRLFADAGNTQWSSRKTTAGELISVLLAPCAKVKRVALDPLPLSLGSTMLPFVSVQRDRFVQYLMGEHRGGNRRACAGLESDLQFLEIVGFARRTILTGSSPTAYKYTGALHVVSPTAPIVEQTGSLPRS